MILILQSATPLYHGLQSPFRTTKSGFRCAPAWIGGTGDTYRQPPSTQQSSHSSQMQEENGAEMVENGRGGALRLRYKPTRKRWFVGLRFLTVPLMNKK